MSINPNYNNDIDLNLEDWLNLALIEYDSYQVDDTFPLVAPPTLIPLNTPSITNHLCEDSEPTTKVSFTYPDLTAGFETIVDPLDLANANCYSTLQPSNFARPEPSKWSSVDNFQLNPFILQLASTSPQTPNLQLFTTPESRWQAVIDRTPDAPFVYALLSTKIYCRATCPSRRPLQNNVKFYDTPAEAAAAGFRPCKRCKPDDVAGEAAEQRQATAVERAKALIEDASRNGERIPLDKLASEAGLSTFYFHRVFRKRVGVTPEEWGKRCRQRSSRA
ncbi:hypothetical protein FRC12_024969 [Ceratobasidium sp. 428]|nr:hypothetical protein FRC12_024969 [Ceratobasidium sp. 428]